MQKIIDVKEISIFSLKKVKEEKLKISIGPANWKMDMSGGQVASSIPMHLCKGVAKHWTFGKVVPKKE